MRVALPRGRRFLAHARLLRPRNQPCASSVGRRRLRTLAPGASVSEDNGYGPHAPPTKWRRKKFNTTFGVRHGKGKRLLKKQMGNRGMAKVRRMGFFPNQSFSRVKTFFAETDPFRFLLPSLRLTSALPPILRLRLDLGIYRSRGIAVTPFPRKREQSERRLFDARGERFSRALLFIYASTVRANKLVPPGKAPTCAVDESGDLKCWGGNEHGEVGIEP